MYIHMHYVCTSDFRELGAFGFGSRSRPPWVQTSQGRQSSVLLMPCRQRLTETYSQIGMGIGTSMGIGVGIVMGIGVGVGIVIGIGVGIAIDTCTGTYTYLE